MSFKRILIGACLAVVVVCSVSIVGHAEERYQDLQLFAKVLNLVEQYYVDPVDTKKLIYGGIKGMLAELDPHTNFLPPDIFKEFQSETSGQFGGIGIEITIKDGVLTIISPIEDTPAWKAGVKPGDKIVSINGESTKGFSLAEAAQRLKGKRGEKIHLGIFRDGFDKPKEFAITRGVVKIHSAKYTDLGDGFAYVRLTSFIENSASEMTKELKAHQKKYGSIKGLILDLRKNPGGLLDQAVQICDLFLDHGVIVSTKGRNQKQKEVLYAKKDGTLENFPLIVLVDEYSASASEIVSGALQDNKRALIMGKRTFGKGSVQSVVKLGDGSGLKLTVGRYYTPSGRSIQSEGITPDIELEDLDTSVIDKALIKRQVIREKDMHNHLLGTKELAEKKEGVHQKIHFWWTETESDQKKKQTPKEKLLSHDFQLQQAFNYLKAWRLLDDRKAAQTVSAAPAPSSAGVKK